MIMSSENRSTKRGGGDEDSSHLHCTSISVPGGTYSQYIAAYQAFLTAN